MAMIQAYGIKVSMGRKSEASLSSSIALCVKGIALPRLAVNLKPEATPRKRRGKRSRLTQGRRGKASGVVR